MKRGGLPGAALACALGLLVGGCAYRLGPTNGEAAGARSIQVVPLQNNVLIPRLGDAVTVSLRRNLQQDGTYRLETRGRGDVILSGAVVSYDRSELSYQPTDVLTPRDFRIIITADLTAREADTGKVLMNRQVTGFTTVRLGADLKSAERQAIPLAAEDLARNAIAMLVDGTW